MHTVTLNKAGILHLEDKKHPRQEVTLGMAHRRLTYEPPMVHPDAVIHNDIHPGLLSFLGCIVVDDSKLQPESLCTACDRLINDLA